MSAHDFDIDEIPSLPIPVVGDASNRTGLYIKAAKLGAEQIKDRPVFAGIIGPFSLVGRLMEAGGSYECIADEDFVSAALEKATEFHSIRKRL